MRTPQTIAAEARHHLDTANKAFVPANVVKLAELQIEFAESVVQTLGDAGLLPAEPKAEEQPAG